MEDNQRQGNIPLVIINDAIYQEKKEIILRLAFIVEGGTNILLFKKNGEQQKKVMQIFIICEYRGYI